MALMSFLYAGWFGDLFDSTPKTYHMVPIDLSKVGNVADFMLRSVDSEKGGHFSLYFVIRKDGKQLYDNRHWINEFVLGGQKREGVSTPIRLTIYRIEQDGEAILFYDKTIEAKGWSGTGGYMNGAEVTYWMRNIDVFSLPKGKYSIRLENIKEFPELKEIEMYFAIHGGRGKY